MTPPREPIEKTTEVNPYAAKVWFIKTYTKAREPARDLIASEAPNFLF